MIIRYQLSQNLKISPQTQIYIISYQDAELGQYLIQDIKSKSSCTTQQCLQFNNSEAWEHFKVTTQNYSLFYEPTCYEIELEKNCLNIKNIPALKPLDRDIFIFKTSVFKHNLLEQLHQLPQCVWIQSYAPNINDLWRWVLSELSEFKLQPTISPWFLTQNNIDFASCKQLIEKIKLSINIGEIVTLSDIQNQIGLQQTEELAPLIEAWMKGETSIALQKLHELFRTSSEVTLLVWLLNRNLQVLFALKENIRSAKTLFEENKIWPKQTSIFLQAQTRFSLSQLSLLIQQLRVIDVDVKSGQTQQVQLKLERFLMLSHHEYIS